MVISVPDQKREQKAMAVDPQIVSAAGTDNHDLFGSSGHICRKVQSHGRARPVKVDKINPTPQKHRMDSMISEVPYQPHSSHSTS